MAVESVLFHIHSMGRGGAERVISVLANRMTENGIRVSLVTLWRENNEYQLDSRIHRISVDDSIKSGNKLIKVVNRYRVLRKIVKEEKPSVVVSFCNKSNFRASISLMGIKYPLIVSVRNNPDMDYLPYKLQTYVMSKVASGCVFQTENARRYFDKNLQNKSIVIWNPLNDDYLKNNENPYRDGCQKRIVSVGRISYQKNHMLLAKAFERIKDDYPEVVVELYGDDFRDGAKEKLVEYLEINGMSDRFVLRGLSKDVIADISDAYMFVMSSDYEGMPNALMEAMALGIPVVSTDCPCGGPAELIEDGVNGTLVSVKDEEGLSKAIKMYLEDTDLRNRISLEAGKIKNKVDSDNIYSQWMDYIEKVINEK